VRFATHFGFRPDFCEAADPESKGVVEALCRYAQEDLIVPAVHWANVDEANDACRAWCVEVNTVVHSTIAASMLDRVLHHAVVVVSEGESYRMREAKTTEDAARHQPDHTHPRWVLSDGHQRGLRGGR
jgi:hypothetical protein